MVKRFYGFPSGVTEHSEGQYVRFEDYDALRAKFDRLVEHVEKAPHASMSCTSHTVQPDGFALPARCGCWKRAVLAEEGR